MFNFLTCLPLRLITETQVSHDDLWTTTEIECGSVTSPAGHFSFQCVAESLQQSEDDTLLKCLIDLAETTPKFLKPQLEMVFSLCLKVYILWFCMI